MREGVREGTCCPSLLECTSDLWVLPLPFCAGEGVDLGVLLGTRPWAGLNL